MFTDGPKSDQLPAAGAADRLRRGRYLPEYSSCAFSQEPLAPYRPDKVRAPAEPQRPAHVTGKARSPAEVVAPKTPRSTGKARCLSSSMDHRGSGASEAIQMDLRSEPLGHSPSRRLRTGCDPVRKEDAFSLGWHRSSLTTLTKPRARRDNDESFSIGWHRSSNVQAPSPSPRRQTPDGFTIGWVPPPQFPEAAMRQNSLPADAFSQFVETAPPPIEAPMRVAPGEMTPDPAPLRSPEGPAIALTRSSSAVGFAGAHSRPSHSARRGGPTRGSDRYQRPASTGITVRNDVIYSSQADVEAMRRNRPLGQQIGLSATSSVPSIRTPMTPCADVSSPHSGRPFGAGCHSARCINAQDCARFEGGEDFPRSPAEAWKFHAGSAQGTPPKLSARQVKLALNKSAVFPNQGVYQHTDEPIAWQVSELRLENLPADVNEKSLMRACQSYGHHVVKVKAGYDLMKLQGTGWANIRLRTSSTRPHSTADLMNYFEKHDGAVVTQGDI
eukprot:NODE_4198_length_1923_cov_10.396993.p1 GENE.NODE_4198_length_1923_cov_10.396993~~NODE_4198_length_1923_cov_10.396993.p1  ORF type:complete len:499 (-),score=113.49 NODE_4198_length_1923_cov_10.396993:315-1811(-)